MKHTPPLFFFVFTATLLAFVFCSNDYNPFTDYSNATTSVVHSSVKNGDTIGIFSTETLSVIILVKELIDSFTIESHGNRMWNKADSTILKKDFDKEPFTFLFSYFDTGRKAISVLTYKANDLFDSHYFFLYAQSPLRQKPITGGFGDSIRLQTLPVKDKDVNYFWSFGAGSHYSSQRCSTTVLLFSALLSGNGAVWVSDGFHVSCADSFDFSIVDTAAPTIVCVNENFVGKDTIYTGDSVFNFKVRIFNRGDQRADSASVNGRRFDRTENKIYYLLIDKMYKYDAPNALNETVFALSHFQNGTQRTKRFTLIFSPNVAPGLPARIKVLTPSRDSTITLLKRYTISGNVENHSFDSLAIGLYAYVNGIEDSIIKPMTGVVSCSWDWNIELSPGVNSVLLLAKDIATLSIIDQVSFSIVFADTAHDSTSPRILAITANGAPAANFYTEKEVVAVGVKAFDEISGIDTMTINGHFCGDPTADNWYYDSVPLRHVQSGNEVLIYARDRKNNDTIASVVLYRNRLPVIQKFPASLFIAIDSLYTDAIDAFDPDNDTVRFEKTEGPAHLSINAQGKITWRPTLLDTGNHSVTVRLWDGYQPIFRTFALYVFGDQGHPGQVRFATSTEDFPSFLEGGKDTLHLPLRITQASGIRPFVFSARIANKSKLLLPEGNDSILAWAPMASDTGFMQLLITVKDAFPSSDTLYPRILVIPPNRPCSLFVNFSGPATSTSAIDLNQKRQKDTLLFMIKDPDNPLIERHTVTLHETRTQMISIIDSAVVDSFSMVLDPLAFDGYDTIIAIIRDRVGAADTIKQKVYYGMPPFSPQAQYPLNLMPITGATVSLTWQDIDPDGDGITYDVYFGSLPDQLTRLAVTTETSYTISGLSPQHNYYWRIVAHDWKSFTEGPVWQFSTR
jgi:hypothetical protein